MDTFHVLRRWNLSPDAAFAFRDEFSLMQVKIKQISMQTLFKTSSRTIIFSASRANSIFSTCQMWHAEYVPPWIFRQLNELQWHFISSRLSAFCLFPSFSFFFFSSCPGTQTKDWEDWSALKEAEFRHRTRPRVQLQLLHDDNLLNRVCDLMASRKSLVSFHVQQQWHKINLTNEKSAKWIVT